MSIMHEIELGAFPAGWETWRCPASDCAQQLLQLARRSPGEDVWLICERPGWLVAAAVPVCPGCGTTLRRES